MEPVILQRETLKTKPVAKPAAEQKVRNPAGPASSSNVSSQPQPPVTAAAAAAHPPVSIAPKSSVVSAPAYVPLEPAAAAAARPPVSVASEPLLPVASAPDYAPPIQAVVQETGAAAQAPEVETKEVKVDAAWPKAKDFDRAAVLDAIIKACNEHTGNKESDVSKLIKEIASFIKANPVFPDAIIFLLLASAFDQGIYWAYKAYEVPGKVGSILSLSKKTDDLRFCLATQPVLSKLYALYADAENEQNLGLRIAYRAIAELQFIGIDVSDSQQSEEKISQARLAFLSSFAVRTNHDERLRLKSVNEYIQLFISHIFSDIALANKLGLFHGCVAALTGISPQEPQETSEDKSELSNEDLESLLNILSTQLQNIPHTTNSDKFKNLSFVCSGIISLFQAALKNNTGIPPKYILLSCSYILRLTLQKNSGSYILFDRFEQLLLNGLTDEQKQLIKKLDDLALTLLGIDNKTLRPHRNEGMLIFRYYPQNNKNYPEILGTDVRVSSYYDGVLLDLSKNPKMLSTGYKFLLDHVWSSLLHSTHNLPYSNTKKLKLLTSILQFTDRFGFNGEKLVTEMSAHLQANVQQQGVFIIPPPEYIDPPVALPVYSGPAGAQAGAGGGAAASENRYPLFSLSSPLMSSRLPQAAADPLAVLRSPVEMAVEHLASATDQISLAVNVTQSDLQQLSSAIARLAEVAQNLNTKLQNQLQPGPSPAP